jgi:hypothetical protein
MMAQRQLSIDRVGLQDWGFEEVRVSMDLKGYHRREM